MQGYSARRIGFMLLLVAASLTTAAAAEMFARTIFVNGLKLVDIPLLMLFVILFFWISIAFWTASFGLLLDLFAGKAPPEKKASHDDKQRPVPLTAVVMPIFNEDPRRVFAGLHAIHDSLRGVSRPGSFDLFVLSDTTNPDLWAQEEAAWADMNSRITGDIGFFYRHRTENRERKAGNIRDFCERWGGRYEYMIVLDADSVMTGRTLVEMVCRMEADPHLGILQVSSNLVNRSSLFGRMLQFSNALYGVLFRQGFGYWSRSEGNYWGHNAIIRLKAFTQSCGLPKLPGRPPWGGEILSHDFVEAAFMLRAGWKVTIAADLGGSYEECPADLIDFAKRDERWSQGNFQHLTLMIASGINPMSRFHMAMGAMSYLASPLWALFMLLSAIHGVGLVASRPILAVVSDVGYLPTSVTLLPLGSAFALLLLIKIWAYLAVALRPSLARRFGGAGKLALSVLLETLISVFLAPILMAFHTTFLINTLMGRRVEWDAQSRQELNLRFSEAYRVHALHTIVGLAAALIITWRATAIFWWMFPIFAALILSVPLSLLLSSVRVGLRLREAGIFLTPEEIEPPDVVVRQQAFLEKEAGQPPPPFVRLVADPVVSGLHDAMLTNSPPGPVQPATKERLLRVTLSGGPGRTSPQERHQLLENRDALSWLHREAWKDWPIDVLRQVATAWQRLPVATENPSAAALEHSHPTG